MWGGIPAVSRRVQTGIGIIGANRDIGDSRGIAAALHIFQEIFNDLFLLILVERIGVSLHELSGIRIGVSRR